MIVDVVHNLVFRSLATLISEGRAEHSAVGTVEDVIAFPFLRARSETPTAELFLEDDEENNALGEATRVGAEVGTSLFCCRVAAMQNLTTLQSILHRQPR